MGIGVRGVMTVRPTPARYSAAWSVPQQQRNRSPRRIFFMAGSPFPKLSYSLLPHTSHARKGVRAITVLTHSSGVPNSVPEAAPEGRLNS